MRDLRDGLGVVLQMFRAQVGRLSNVGSLMGLGRVVGREGDVLVLSRGWIELWWLLWLLLLVGGQL